CSPEAIARLYRLSLHDALPISATGLPATVWCRAGCFAGAGPAGNAGGGAASAGCGAGASRSGSVGGAALISASLIRPVAQCSQRSEEHTSELQSHLNLVCPLLL